MVRPIMEKRCGDLLENGGALPRVGPECQHSTAEGKTQPKLRKVSIPVLSKMGMHTNQIAGCESTIEVVDLQDDAVADVYDLFRRASPSSLVQRGLDFSRLLDISAIESPHEWAIDLHGVVIASWNEMHERGYYFLSLYEAALVTMECCSRLAARLKVLQENPISTGSGGCGGGNGVEREWLQSDLSMGRDTGGAGQSEGGRMGGGEGASGGDVLHWSDVKKREDFLRKVLAIATGATKLSGAPSLPGFSVGALIPDEPGGDLGPSDALLKYGEVSALLKRTCITCSPLLLAYLLAERAKPIPYAARETCHLPYD